MCNLNRSDPNLNEDATDCSTSSDKPRHIELLNHDVLCLVFDLIASHFPGFGQRKSWHEIMSFSQVCRSWRGLILASPALWGKVIDLDTLFTTNEERRDEYLLGRASTGVLWIRGRHYTNYKDALPELLAKHWERIEKLWIKVPVKNFQNRDDRIWMVFHRPAPYLTLFVVEDTKCPGDTMETPMLFADTAPKLQEFNAPFVLSRKICWLVNVTTLILSNIRSFSEVLAPLKSMPKLYFLSITQSSALLESAPSLSTQVNLQELRRLELNADNPECARFLSHINPRPGCSLHIMSSVGEPSLTTTSEYLDLILLKYFNNYANDSNKIVRGIKVQTNATEGAAQGALTFVAFTNPTCFEDKTSFSVRLDRSSYQIYEQFLSGMGKNSTSTLSQVEVFICLLHQQLSSSSSLKSVLLGVRSLHANSRALEFLFDSSTEPVPLLIFPGLETISLEVNFEARGSLETINFLRMFLQKQKDTATTTGRPTATLDITNVVAKISRDDWNILEEVKGLRVIHHVPEGRFDEYTCGRGSGLLSGWVDNIKLIWNEYHQGQERANLSRAAGTPRFNPLDDDFEA